jgi:pimeloyl-ACP methyl ester carboxylesterase
MGDADMSLETEQTRFVETSGIRFAYRSFGRKDGVSLVFLQHFTGTMDSWDPALVNALAETRPVIVFDNTGVGKSSGTTPENVEQMTADAAAFMAALALEQVDVLGYSLGGCIAQVLAAQDPSLVRRLIVAGSVPRGGEEHLLAVLKDARSRGVPDPRVLLFFTPSEASQAAGEAFVKRAAVRVNDRDPDSTEAVANPQAKAIITWCAVADSGHASLKAITQPTLIVHGSDDTMFPSGNAYEMFKAMKNAQLIIYPDSGHGAIFQHHKTFAANTLTFLDG